MSRESHRGKIMEGLIMPTKIRKRGCSSSSSSSSRIRNHRLNKRAGKTRAGLLIGIAGSRSSTPVPTWRTTPLRSSVDSPKCSQSGRLTQPVSARRLAATLWEMHEVPSPKMSERNVELMKKKSESKMVFSRDKMESGCRLHSGSRYLPRHLSDPSHSPTVSEKMDQSAAGSRHRTPSISQRLRSAEQNTAVFDSISNASLKGIETRSHLRTPSGSVTGDRNRLKDITNALTTSKELLKIINRLWARADQPSSSMSVISALHAELERARLQVNTLTEEQQSDRNDINHLMKCWAEEKASWKLEEQRLVEEAIESVAGELEVERKLRKRLERLNKKLGKELVELKMSFVKAVEDLETEKRAREITEQMCGELVRNIDGDKDEAKKVKMEPVEVQRHSEEKNSAIGKLRKQLEVFIGTKRDKDEKRSTHSTKSHFVIPEKNEQEDEDEKDESAESDVQSIRSNMKDNNKSRRWAYSSGTGHESMKLLLDEIKARNSISGQVSRKSTCMFDGVEGVSHHRNSGDGYDKVEALKRMGIKDHRTSSSSRLSLTDIRSPSRQGDHFGALQARDTAGTQAVSSKLRLVEVRGEGLPARRSKR